MKIEEILTNLSGRVVSTEYDLRASGRLDWRLEQRDKFVREASAEIKKAVLEALPKAVEVKIIELRKNPKPIDYLLEGRKEGYNQALSDITKAVENL